MTCPVCLLWKFQHFPPALILPLNMGLEWAGLTCYSSKSEDYDSVADQMSKWQDQPVTGNLHESSCSPWILQRRCFLSANNLRRAAPSRCLCSSEQDPAQGRKNKKFWVHLWIFRLDPFERQTFGPLWIFRFCMSDMFVLGSKNDLTCRTRARQEDTAAPALIPPILEASLKPPVLKRLAFQTTFDRKGSAQCCGRIISNWNTKWRTGRHFDVDEASCFFNPRKPVGTCWYNSHEVFTVPVRMASRNIGRLFINGARNNLDLQISQTPDFHCRLAEIPRADFPVLLSSPNQSEIDETMWFKWFRFFMYFVFPVFLPVLIRKHGLLSMPVMSPRSWPPETGVTTEAAYSVKVTLALPRDAQIAARQLAACSFLHLLWILPVQRARIGITRYILLTSTFKISKHVNTWNLHRWLHILRHAIHAKRFSVPSGWRRLAQAVDFGAFLVHGREHGIWRVPKRWWMLVDAGSRQTY